MDDQQFDEKDLIKCNWQYSVIHKMSYNFHCGEKVFLKSNPKVIMVVSSVNSFNITASWLNTSGELQLFDFNPECLLQIKYAGLLVYKNRIYVNLN